MAGSGSSSQGEIFDVRRIRRLVELMNEHELTEIDLRQADTRIRIRRGNDQIQVLQPQGNPPLPAAPASQAAPPAASAPAAASEDHLVVVYSPMVGTFYTSPKPGEPNFVKVGDRVSPETTVCIIEAMKVFNEIPAEVSGTVVSVLVDNEQPVEYKQPLFKVDPNK